jgi:predicted anti-sigma-YlaC factor YlaD
VTTCPRAESLELYLEGELGPYEARKIEEHLERCAGCREALEERRLLHEAFTSLAPIEVPPDFARSVMGRLPEPEGVKSGWLAPLAAAAASLVVGLLGFHLLTGQGLSEVLVATNRFFGQALARFLPLAVKAFKIINLLLKIASDLLALAGAGIATAARFLGPQGIALLLGLGVILLLLACLGARRLHSLGEKT